MIEAQGVDRIPVPSNSPPYNIELQPARKYGYGGSGSSTAIGGSAVGWAEYFLADALTARDSNDASAQAAETRLRNAALDTTKVSDSRLAASALLNWALEWRSAIYGGTLGPTPAPVLAPGVLAVGANAVTSGSNVTALLEAAGVDPVLYVTSSNPDSQLGGIGDAIRAGDSVKPGVALATARPAVSSSSSPASLLAFIEAYGAWILGGLVALVVLAGVRRRA